MGTGPGATVWPCRRPLVDWVDVPVFSPPSSNARGSHAPPRRHRCSFSFLPRRPHPSSQTLMAAANGARRGAGGAGYAHPISTTDSSHSVRAWMNGRVGQRQLPHFGVDCHRGSWGEGGRGRQRVQPQDACHWRERRSLRRPCEEDAVAALGGGGSPHAITENWRFCGNDPNSSRQSKDSWSSVISISSH